MVNKYHCQDVKTIWTYISASEADSENFRRVPVSSMLTSN